MTAKYGIASIRMKSVGVSLKPSIVIAPRAVPEIDYKYDRVFDARTIERLLLEGMLPIIEVKMRGIGMNHWVAVIGSDDTDFLVMDPLNQGKTPVKLSEHGGRAYAYRVLTRQ